MEHGIFVSSTESIPKRILDWSKLRSFSVNLESGESGGFVIAGKSSVMMNNASLFGGSWRVNSLKPSSHEFGKIDSWCFWEKSISDIVSESLESLWWEKLRKGGSVRYTLGN
ncbi:hypothetical protein EI008_26315 [Escherichia coli]|nr:hypothetical protein [Escherichia coli]